MQSAASLVSSLRRPKTLVTAARLRAKSYAPERDLPPDVRTTTPNSNARLMRLVELEAECDSARRANTGFYDAPQHVTILGCLIGELRA